MTAVTNAAGFPILSLITFLPLIGCVVIMTVRGDEETIASNARWTALWTSLLVLALSLTLSRPVLVPVAVGVKVTLIVQWLPALPMAGRRVPHVVAETAKSPIVEIAIPVRSTGWLFVNLNVFAALVVPTFWLA